MRTFRVATYNIHKGRGIDGRTRIARIARVLAEIEPEIVALQEVVCHCGRELEYDQARYLGETLGYWISIGETRKHQGGVYGNVTLSKRKPRRSVSVDVSVSGREPRGILRTDIMIGGKLVHVFNAHLGTGFFERRRQAIRLLEEDLLRALDIAGPRILLGDLNEWTRGQVSRALHEEFAGNDLRCHLKRRRSFPSFAPMLHLDHVYLDNHLEAQRAFFYSTPLSLVASDHLPLVADVRFIPGGIAQPAD
jgi:endonuclease/exonuclease/phosphatase family metal-dependent hydrolase